MWLYFLGCFDMDEWMRAARAAAPHLAHTLMLLLTLSVSPVRLERDNLHTAETSRVRGVKTQKSKMSIDQEDRHDIDRSGPNRHAWADGPRAVAELPGLDVELGRWQRLEARALSHRTQLRSEAP